MIIGVDFDNTIVCYDRLIREAALERGLIPAELAASKSGVRDYLRQQGREELWTELQGYIYGPGLTRAEPFAGVREFFVHCRVRGVELFIISHKTPYPFLGPPYDLHQAARAWLQSKGFHDPEGPGLALDHVYLELTKEEKLARIGLVGCDYFIDDLPELLSEPGFPGAVERILFDPNGHYPHYGRYSDSAADGPGASRRWLIRATSWTEIQRQIFPPSPDVRGLS